MSLVPDKAVVLKDGKETEVPVSAVQVGDIVVLKTGSRVPVDGIVVKAPVHWMNLLSQEKAFR